MGHSFPPRSPASEPIEAPPVGRGVADFVRAAREGIAFGRWGATRIRLGWSCVVLALTLLGGAWALRGRPADDDLPALAVLILLLAAAGCLLQSGLHLMLSRLLDAHPRAIVLTAVGYRVDPNRGIDRDRPLWLWLARAATPTVALILLAITTLFLDRSGGASENIAPALINRAADGLSPAAPARVARWTWGTQSVLMLSPIPGTVGRGLLVALVFALAAASGKQHAERIADRIQGSLAILLIAAGVWSWRGETLPTVLPAWPFLILLGVLMWCTRGPSALQVGEPEATWRWSGDDSTTRNLRWWTRRRIRQVQKSEYDEAIDSERLDAILRKLHLDGVASLTKAERAVLRRVSQRLRQRRQEGR